MNENKMPRDIKMEGNDPRIPRMAGSALSVTCSRAIELLIGRSIMESNHLKWHYSPNNVHYDLFTQHRSQSLYYNLLT